MLLVFDAHCGAQEACEALCEMRLAAEGVQKLLQATKAHEYPHMKH